MNRFLLVLLLAIVLYPGSGSLFAQQASPHGLNHLKDQSVQRVMATTAETWNEKRNYNWTSSSANWELNNVTHATRNVQDQIETEIVLTPGPLGLDSSLRYIYTYVVIGEPWTERLDQVWNGAGWEDNTRQIHNYDTQGNLILDLELLWTGGAWDTVSGARFLYTYNGNNDPTEVINENWDAQNEVFEPLSRDRYSYNSAGVPDTAWTDAYNQGNFVPSSRLLDLTWNDFDAGQPAGYYRQFFNNGFWANGNRFTWTYGANGSYEQINLEWINSAWTIIGKYNVDIDAQDRLTSFERFDFVNNAYIFQTGAQFQITYDGNFQPTEIIRLVAATDSIYDNMEKDEFTAIVGRSPSYQPYQGLSLYPNPFENTLDLELSDIKAEDLHFELFDMMGRKVFERQWRTGSGRVLQHFNLPELRSGVYSFRLSGETGVSSGQLLRR